MASVAPLGLYINHNMPAIVANDNLARAYGRLAVSTMRLSSGLRINTAADDAAGLAVREFLRTEIAALNQGVRNANDAVSLIQTADGAMEVIDEKLIRMKELAEQAATGTYTSDERIMIDNEYQAMASEVTRIANATDFNGIYLLNGNLSGPESAHNGNLLTPTGPLKIHFGTGNDPAEDYYYVSIANSTASALGVGATVGNSVSTQALAQAALTVLDRAITSKDKIRTNLGALQNRLQNTMTVLQIQSENFQAAESRISDVDVASEMINYVRNQILTEAGTAMLAQANNMPKLALILMNAA